MLPPTPRKSARLENAVKRTLSKPLLILLLAACGTTSSPANNTSTTGTAGSTGTTGSTGSTTPVLIQGVSEIVDVVAVGDTVFFTGTEGGGEQAIMSATATGAGVGILCKGGSARTFGSLVVDGDNLYALSRDILAGTAKIVTTTKTGSGSACTELPGTLTPHLQTTMIKLGSSFVYRGTTKVMKFPVAGGIEADFLTTQATGFLTNFAVVGGNGFVVDTTTASSPGAHLLSFTEGSTAGVEFKAFNSPVEAGFLAVGSSIVWSEPGGSVGQVTFKYRDAGSASSVTATTGPSISLAVGSVIVLCGSTATSFGFAVTNGDGVGYYTGGLNQTAAKKVTSSSAAANACAITSNAFWWINNANQLYRVATN